MISTIENVINKTMLNFLTEVSDEFHIPLQQLQTRWEHFLSKNSVDREDAPEAVLKKKPQKKSAYQKFFVLKSAELKQNNPELSFGALSTQVSTLWKAIPKEEQQKFDVGDDIIKQDNDVTVHKYTADSLNKMKMVDLKQLCEERNIKKTGNKHLLIKALLDNSPVSESPRPVLLPTVVENDTEEVEVILAKNVKRSDIEEEIQHSDDEQDFEFEDDDNDDFEGDNDDDYD